MAVNNSIFCQTTLQNTCLRLWNITTLFITPWTLLEIKEQLAGLSVSIKHSQPSFLWKLTHGYFPFYSWVADESEWRTVPAKHLLVFLVTLLHERVSVCAALFSITFLCCILLISIPCLWLSPCSWYPRGLLSTVFVAPTFYCESCQGKPWPFELCEVHILYG